MSANFDPSPPGAFRPAIRDQNLSQSMCVTYRTGYSRSQGAPRMATISKAETDEVKARHQLSAIIGRTVKLRKAGNEYVGLCPYHSEKSPARKSTRLNSSH